MENRHLFNDQLGPNLLLLPSRLKLCKVCSFSQRGLLWPAAYFCDDVFKSLWASHVIFACEKVGKTCLGFEAPETFTGGKKNTTFISLLFRPNRYESFLDEGGFSLYPIITYAVVSLMRELVENKEQRSGFVFFVSVLKRYPFVSLVNQKKPIVGARMPVCIPSSFLSSYGAESGNLLDFTHVGDELFNAALELWQTGEGVGGLQFSGKIKPAF